MPKPAPEWLPRVEQMQTGEVIIIDDPNRCRQTVRWHLVRHVSQFAFQVSCDKADRFKIKRTA